MNMDEPQPEKSTAVVPLGTYGGVEIHATERDGYLYYFATAICQANGKLWGHYWDNKGTKEFLAVVESDIGIPISELVISIKGGDPRLQGTWVHEEIVIDLAQWCSKGFALWVGRAIRKLLRTGHVSIVKEHTEHELATKYFGEKVTATLLNLAAGQVYVQQELAETKEEVHELKYQMDGVKQDMKDVKYALAHDVLKPRKRLPRPVRRSHAAVIRVKYDGKCPCCRDT